MVSPDIKMESVFQEKKRTAAARSRLRLHEIITGSNGLYKSDKIIDTIAVPYLFLKECKPSEPGQYALQSKIYEIIPENSPRIFTSVRNPNGEVIAYVMEKINGQSLLELIDSSRLSLYLTEVGITKADLKLDLRKAVNKLHAAGISHGDLMLRNIIIDYRGRVMLIDARGKSHHGRFYRSNTYIRDSKGLALIFKELDSTQ